MDDYQIREEQKGIKRRGLPLPDSCWWVCADQEDGAVEARVSSGDTPPKPWHSPLFICYMPLSHKTGKKVRW